MRIKPNDRRARARKATVAVGNKIQCRLSVGPSEDVEWADAAGGLSCRRLSTSPLSHIVHYIPAHGKQMNPGTMAVRVARLPVRLGRWDAGTFALVWALALLWACPSAITLPAFGVNGLSSPCLRCCSVPRSLPARARHRTGGMGLWACGDKGTS